MPDIFDAPIETNIGQASWVVDAWLGSSTELKGGVDVKIAVIRVAGNVRLGLAWTTVSSRVLRVLRHLGGLAIVNHQTQHLDKGRTDGFNRIRLKKHN